MSPKLRERLDYSLEEIARLRDDFGARIARGAEGPLDPDETIVLSTALHGFYNLCESMLKAIAVEYGENPTASDWHTRLVRGFAEGGSSSGLAFSEELLTNLSAYMRFRHMFRHIYILDIEAELLRPLLANYERVQADFVGEIQTWMGGEDDR